MREILWRVEERLSPELEKSLKDRPHDVRAQIIKETAHIYRQKEQVTQDIKNQLNMDNDQADRLTFQALLYKAQHGQDPSPGKLLEMKTVMQSAIALLPAYQSGKHASKEVHDLATDKASCSVFSDQKGKALHEIKETFEKEISKTNHYLQKLHAQQMAYQRERSSGLDLSM